MARVSTILALIAVIRPAPLPAQDVAYLAEVPTAQRVAEGLAVASPRETAARRYAALFALGNLLGSAAGAAPSPQVQGRMVSFDRMRDQVYEAEKQRDPVNYLLERCSQAYSDSPAFMRELLDVFFTPGWQATYGPRLDPRRWKRPLAMAPGAKVTAASMTPPMVEECGSAPAPPGSDPAAAPGTTATVAAKSTERAVGPLAAEGNAYLKAGDTTRALATFKASVAKDPSEPLGYTGLGRIYSARQQYSLSVEAWQKAAALVPADWSVSFSLAVAYHGQKQYAEARDAYRKTLRLKLPPDYAPYVYEGLGVAYLALGQRDSAVAAYRALVPLDSARASGLAARINATAPAAASTLGAAQKAQVEDLRKEGKKNYDAKLYSKARVSYEKLLRIDPNDGWALYELGLSLLMAEGTDDVDSMQVVWKRAVALNPTDTELLLTLGDALYTWDPEPAYTALQRVLDLRPDAATQARAHSIMGWSHFFFMDSRSAAAEFREAMRLDPGNDQYLYALGHNYAKAGQKDAAMAVHRQLTSRNQKMAKELMETINKK